MYHNWWTEGKGGRQPDEYLKSREGQKFVSWNSNKFSQNEVIIHQSKICFLDGGVVGGEIHKSRKYLWVQEILCLVSCWNHKTKSLSPLLLLLCFTDIVNSDIAQIEHIARITRPIFWNFARTHSQHTPIKYRTSSWSISFNIPCNSIWNEKEGRDPYSRNKFSIDNQDFVLRKYHLLGLTNVFPFFPI